MAKQVLSEMQKKRLYGKAQPPKKPTKPKPKPKDIPPPPKKKPTSSKDVPGKGAAKNAALAIEKRKKKLKGI